MASTGRIVKIIKEKDGTFTVMTTSTGRGIKKNLDEVLEAVKDEYKEN